MVTFDFITDDKFRNSLESDYRELNKAMETESWKSVHVLAGSIIEAVLIDYLLATSYKNMTEDAILKMDLSDAIAACQSTGILSERTVHLSHVIRSYRNLIHPGRVSRLNETVDKEGATVAQTLVEIVVREVTEERKKKYGLTAEQVVANLESAPSRIAILDRLLEGFSLTEKRRLLLKVIPQHHFEQELLHTRLMTEMEEDGYSIAPLDQTSLEKGFRLAFDTAPDELKRDVVANLITILKEDSESKILSYERAFFKMSDLRYCSPDDAKLVKEHILSVLPNHYKQILSTLDGIEDFLAHCGIVWSV